ncbi:MAG: ribose 5-phosphate isomerase B [Clostridia bacterium]|nr:ribose 5-phosphate isomerase B [Clostridia bacterium]
MENKKLAIASDHAGYGLKNFLADHFRKLGYEVTDLGTDSEKSCDYPVFAEKLADFIISGGADLGILCCGTGIGMSIAANKVPGIRAAACSDTFSAKYTRLHNDANVLCLGARVVGEGLAAELADIFVTTGFEGGKHARRVGLITGIEKREK